MPKIHNKKKGDGIYVTVRSKGVRRGHKHQLAHVSKKWCIVETDVIFLYLATWNVPRMFRNMKHLWKNVTQERRYPQRGSGLRTHWPPFCAGLADSIGQVFTIGHLFFCTEFRNCCDFGKHSPWNSEFPRNSESYKGIHGAQNAAQHDDDDDDGNEHSADDIDAILADMIGWRH